jgi:hypothetical protein
MRVVQAKKSLIKRLSMTLVPVIAAFALVVSTGVSYAATPTVVYNNIPNPQPANVVSLGFEATSTSEFGGQVGLASSERINPSVTVSMSSWACQTGTNTATCTTVPGATFNQDVTLNVYNVNADNSVGSVVVSKTMNFAMPYRPSADGCGGSTTAWTGPDRGCYNGKAFPITFDLNATLPDKVIIGVAYNTSHYGAQPTGVAGPYDSLNVGLAGSPTVGTALPSEQDAYLNSSWSGAYCDTNTTDKGHLRLDAGCWGGYLPAFKVTASGVTPTNKDQCKKDGWKSFGTMFKNQGDCVSSTNR